MWPSGGGHVYIDGQEEAWVAPLYASEREHAHAMARHLALMTQQAPKAGLRPQYCRIRAIDDYPVGWHWGFNKETAPQAHMEHPERLTKRRDKAIHEAKAAAVELVRRRGMCALALELEARFSK